MARRAAAMKEKEDGWSSIHFDFSLGGIRWRHCARLSFGLLPWL